MRSPIAPFLSCLAACLLAVGSAPALADDDFGYSAVEPAHVGPVSIETFFHELSPYGEWIEVGGLGRCWRPYEWVVGVGFQPYANAGHWEYTTYGWSFVSDWSWGWGPFHYGRWYSDSSLGWIWVPGTEWGPAWVEWRFGGGYVGWSPLPPVGLGFARVSRPVWVYVEAPHFVRSDFHRHIVPRWRHHEAVSVTRSWTGAANFAGRGHRVGPVSGPVGREARMPVTPVVSPPPSPQRTWSRPQAAAPVQAPRWSLPARSPEPGRPSVRAPVPPFRGTPDGYTPPVRSALTPSQPVSNPRSQRSSRGPGFGGAHARGGR